MRPVALKESRPEIITGALNDCAEGRLNNGGLITLTANAASTTVYRPGISVGDCIAFAPTTANAAAAMATTYIKDADVTKNQFIITHANNAQTDRTFRYTFFAVQVGRH